MKHEIKDLALRITCGYQVDDFCRSCLFYDIAKKCTTPLPIQYQAIEPGKGMIDCSNYLIGLSKPGRGTSEASYSDRLLDLWMNRPEASNILTGKMRADKQRPVKKSKRGHPETEANGLLLELEKQYKSMKGVPTRNLKLRHSMVKYLLRLVIEDRRRMEHHWYVNSLERIMSDYLGNELQRLMRELEGK